MVPLESESGSLAGEASSAALGARSEGDGSRSGEGERACQKGAAADIARLSKLALKDAVLELETTMYTMNNLSSAAVLQLWQTAERRLGVEVHIEDPALRGLFGLQVVAVEDLCNRVRAQAEATLVAVQWWSQPQLHVAAEGLQLLCEQGASGGRAGAGGARASGTVPSLSPPSLSPPSPSSPSSPSSPPSGAPASASATFEPPPRSAPAPASPAASPASGAGGGAGGVGGACAALASDLKDAGSLVERAHERLAARIETEVCGRIDARLREHALMRDVVRDRQKWSGFASAARRDVARLRKGSAGESGLTALTGDTALGPLEQAELRLGEATKHVAELDEKLLVRLSELQSGCVDAVRRPWAALVQIQSEFFTAQQAAWAPLTSSLDDYAADMAPAAAAR